MQIFVIYFTKSFIAFAAIQSLFTIAEGLSLSYMMNKEYPVLCQKEKVKLPENVIRKIWGDVQKIFISKIGKTVIESTDNLVLSNVVGLVVIGKYSNYVLIKASLQAIVCQFQTAISASVGNIVAMGEREKEFEYFWFLNFLTTVLYSMTSICLYNLMQPFIVYWLGGEFLMSKGVLLCTTMVYYLSGVRGIFDTFSMAHGVFDLEAKKAVMEAIVNLVLSIVLAIKFGVVGVLVGTVVSSLLIGLPMELKNVCHALPEISKKRYAKEFVLYVLTTLLALLVSVWCCDKISMNWYIRLPLGAAISIGVCVLTWWFIWGRTERAKHAIKLIKSVLNRSAYR